MRLMSFFVALVLVSTAARANEANSIPGWEEYKAGRYSETVDIGRAAQTADGYAIACRANLLSGGYELRGREAFDALQTAIADCEKALRLDPKHMDARLSLTFALGYEAKRLGSATLATQTRKEIEHLIRLYPGHPIPAAALGGWHGAIANGGFIVRLYLGGSHRRAGQWFDYAVELGVDDIYTLFEYTKYLAKRKKNDRAVAIAVLEDITTRTPETAIDANIIERAKTLLESLKNGKKSDVRQAVIDLSAFPDIKEFKKEPSFDYDRSLWAPSKSKSLKSPPKRDKRS